MAGGVKKSAIAASSTLNFRLFLVISVVGSKIKMPFVATGRLSEYVTKDDVKVKGFYLETATDTHFIKLSKLLRQVLPATIAPGTEVEVKGEQCIDGKKGTSKLKALIVRPQSVIDPALVSSAIAGASSSHAVAVPIAPEAKPKKQRILVCQKSSCCKRGARKVWQALVTALDEADLSDLVQLKATGCIDKCKQGPNVIFTPGKHRFSKVRPEVAADLVREHLGDR